MEKVFTVIAQSSIALFAVIGTFVIFQLQWFRREIDDFKGRIFDVLERNKIIKTDTDFFEMTDNVFFDVANKYKDKFSDQEIQRGVYRSKYKNNFGLLKRRMEGKRRLISFIIQTILLLSIIFLFNILGFYTNLKFLHGILSIVITIFFYSYIIFKLVGNLKKY